jgi:hypothetical protein
VRAAAASKSRTGGGGQRPYGGSPGEGPVGQAAGPSSSFSSSSARVASPGARHSAAAPAAKPPQPTHKPHLPGDSALKRALAESAAASSAAAAMRGRRWTGAYKIGVSRGGSGLCALTHNRWGVRVCYARISAAARESVCHSPPLV